MDKTFQPKLDDTVFYLSGGKICSSTIIGKQTVEYGCTLSRPFCSPGVLYAVAIGEDDDYEIYKEDELFPSKQALIEHLSKD